MFDLKKAAENLGIYSPPRVAEIASGWPEFSYMGGYIAAGVPTLLVEPQRDLYDRLVAVYGDRKNVEIIQAMITPDGKPRRMVRPLASDMAGIAQEAYMEGVSAPIHGHMYDVHALVFDSDVLSGAMFCRMSEIDPGDIDVLNLDVEGSEWIVLETMISRPRLIHVELFGPHGYVNPDLAAIQSWMTINGYAMKHQDGQNRIYVRP